MTATRGCTHATAAEDCPCWREGVRTAHNRVATQASADQAHHPTCRCPECETIQAVMLAGVYDAAYDSYLAHYPKTTHVSAMTPQEWKAWAEHVARECSSAVVPVFTKGYMALAIVEAGNLARLLATRIARNAGEHRVADIVNLTIMAARDRMERAGPVGGHCTPLLCHGCPCADCARRCHGQASAA